jgi:aspartate/methionine/tyrosine aminotransferase
LNAEFRSVALRFDEAKRCFELDVEALAEALGPQTAALIVNTPRGWPRTRTGLGK